MLMHNNKGQLSIGVVFFLFLFGIFLIYLAITQPFQESLVVLLAIVFFLIAFLKTDIALIIVILSMLLSPELRAGAVSSRNVNVRAEDLFIFVIFFGWLAKMAVKKELGLMKRNPLNAPILIYIGICVVSSLIGLIQGRIDFRESFFYLLKYFEYFLLFFLVNNNLRTYKQAKLFVFFLLFTCFIVCAMAWVQIPSGERLSAPFESEGGEPNTFAGYLLLMMSILLGLFFTAATRRKKMFFLGFFVFAAIPFLLTLSREGWISFFPALLAFMVFNKRSRMPLAFVIIIGVIVMPYLLPKRVHERAQDAFAKEKSYQVFGKRVHVSESFAARIDTWDVGLTRLTQRPFLGHGTPGGGVIDNQYTRVMVETGMIGFAAFLWMLILLFRLAFKSFSGSTDDFTKGIALGFICGFVGLLTQSLGAAVFILIRIMEPFWFLAAIVVSLPEVIIEEQGNLEEAGQEQR
jgi:O-antigen ligase